MPSFLWLQQYFKQLLSLRLLWVKIPRGPKNTLKCTNSSISCNLNSTILRQTYLEKLNKTFQFNSETKNICFAFYFKRKRQKKTHVYANTKLLNLKLVFNIFWKKKNLFTFFTASKKEFSDKANGTADTVLGNYPERKIVNIFIWWRKAFNAFLTLLEPILWKKFR